MLMEPTDADIDEPDKHAQLATTSDKAHVQRSSTSSIVSIRSLGSGSFATVDLVSMPVGAERKLLVRKMLLAGDQYVEDLTGTAVQTASSSQVLAAALKPSSPQDWHREAAMHRECAHCPFVLQLLAAKHCRSGNLLLLLEYAAQGSLTDILATRKLQLQQSAAGGQLALPSSEPAGSTPASPQAVTSGGQQLQQLASPAADLNAVVNIAAADLEVDVVLPLAVTAAHMIEEDALAVEEALVDCGNAAHRQSQLLQPAVGDEPVLITLLEDASLAAAVHIEGQDTHAQDTHAQDTHAQDTVILTTVAAAAVEAATAAAVGSLHPVAYGLSEESARFYAACILMALRTLHSRRILHRDIKPCNLLLFHDGYLKLADLGCCCQLPEGVPGARTRTGTAAYMAPEVIAGTEAYSYPVDMWSVGVVIWQMVAGSLPDWAQQQEQQEHPGVHYAPAELDFPKHFSKALCDLLDGLLHQDTSARLDIDAVKGCAWFDGFDWQALQDKTMEPPALGLTLAPST